MPISNTTPVVLDKIGITVALNRLAKHKEGRAAELYGRLMSSWGHLPDRQRVTLKLGDEELQLLKSLRLNGHLRRDVVESGYLVTYRHPKRKDLEVRVRSKKKPPRRKTFTIGGSKRRLVAVSVVKLNSTKEAVHMAAKTRSKKAKVEEDELDELEGLEDLDDLEDEDLEDEEPEDEEEDEEDEEEEPAPKRSRKTAAKKAPAKKASTRSRKKAAADEDEDEEEDEAPARKRTAKSKTTAKKSSGNGKGNLPATRELPKGKLGPQDIADMVGGDCDARYVRIFLRESEDYEREDGGRWAFGKQEARTLVKEIKAKRKESGAS